METGLVPIRALTVVVTLLCVWQERACLNEINEKNILNHFLAFLCRSSALCRAEVIAFIRWILQSYGVL